MPFFGDGNPGPYVVANPLPALAFRDGSKNVKAALKPVIEAVGDLHRLMRGMIGGIESIHSCLRAVEREIAVEFNHSTAGIYQIRSVHLNFIVVLSMRESRSQAQDEE